MVPPSGVVFREQAVHSVGHQVLLDAGIMRGEGPDIAWFKDPAGNVLSVLTVD